mmetsp:Transcript_38465/g.37981  ORF Transcript_38465/g.37981 Transcript_38465/m.37981 type:complete len:83 (+) Transcript_38465:157-405(+)
MMLSMKIVIDHYYQSIKSLHNTPSTSSPSQSTLTKTPQNRPHDSGDLNETFSSSFNDKELHNSSTISNPSIPHENYTPPKSP